MQKNLLSLPLLPQNIQHCTKWFLLNFHFHARKNGKEEKKAGAR